MYPTLYKSLSRALGPILVCLCLPALGQQESERSWNLGLALGHGERDNPLVSGESIDINAVIDFSWYGERFFFDNGDFGFTLRESKRWSMNLVATVNNERNYYNYLSGKSFGLDSIAGNRFELNGSSISSTPLAGDEDVITGGTIDSTTPDNSFIDMLSPEEAEILVDPGALNRETELPDRDFALNSGAEFLYISPWGDVQAQLLTDVSGTHNGQEAWLSWTKPWYTRNSQVTLTLGLEWKSHDLIGYYYGVQPDEAFSGRAEYGGAAGTNRFVRLAARHRLGRHWQLVGMLEREYLSGAIRNSPITDLAAVDTFFAGLFYQF